MPVRPALTRAATVVTLCAVTIGVAVGGASPATADTVTTWEASAPIPIGTNPGNAAVDPTTQRAFVSAGNDGLLNVIDTSTNSSAGTIPAQTLNPRGILVDPATHLIYTAGYGATIAVTGEDGTAGTAITVPGASSLGAMSLDAANDTLYVSGTDSGGGGPFGGSPVIYAVDLTDGSATTAANFGFGLPGMSSTLAVDTTAGVAYSGTGQNTIADLATGTISSSPSLGSAIAVDPTRHALWTANPNGTASLIDTRTDALVRTVPLDGSPAAIVIDPDRGLVYVANSSYNSVSVIDEDTFAVLATVPVDAGPDALALNAATHDVYVVNYGASSVSAIHESTQTVVPKPQKVSFTSKPPARAYVQGTYTAAATGGGSGNRVLFSTDPRSSACNVSLRGSVVFTRAGTCIIDADQDGSDAWADAPTAKQTFTVAQRTQTLSFPTPKSLKVRKHETLGATSSAKLKVTYTVGTPKTCSVSGSTVTAKAAGSCTINANAAGNAVYTEAKTKSVKFAVTK